MTLISLRIKVFKVQHDLTPLWCIPSLFPHRPTLCSGHLGLLARPPQARTLPSWAIARTVSSVQNAYLPRVCLGNSLPSFKSLLKSVFSKRLSMTTLFKFANPLHHSPILGISSPFYSALLSVFCSIY